MEGARVPEPLAAAAAGLGQELGRRARPRDGRKRLLAALKAGGYEPITDAVGTIRLRNCPYDALVDEHRDLVCGTNLAMAQGMTLGAEVESLSPVLDPQPGFCCVAFVPRTP